MSSKPRAPSLRGIEVRTDSRGQKRYRGMARDRLADKNIKGPWTTSHSEARSWRIDAKARIQAGTLSGHLGPTVGDAAKEFVIGIKNGSIRQRGGHTYKPSTARGYEQKGSVASESASCAGLRCSNGSTASPRASAQRQRFGTSWPRFELCSATASCEAGST
jgi:hypothetical protein